MNTIQNTQKVIQVESFVKAMEGLMLGMQEIDSSCMEAYTDVTKREFSLLVMMGRSGSMIMREIAGFLKVPLSTATGIIDKLIQKGYVVRDTSPDDRRIIIVQLSAEGRNIYNSLQEKMYCMCEQLLESFSREDRTQFVDYMNRAIQALKPS